MSTIRCEAHGDIEWEGDVMCVSCKAIYLCEGYVEDDDGKRRLRYPDAPPKGMCSCGKRLFGGDAFTARPACRECATRVLTAN